MKTPIPAKAPNGATGQAGDWLALYGSLMRGLGAMDELGLGEQVRYIGPCVLPGELFDLGNYPGLRPGRARVIAELYVVIDPTAFDALDEFEDFDPSRPRESLYLRESIELIEPIETRAWTYLYNHVPDASRRLPGGDWRAHLLSRESDSSP